MFAQCIQALSVIKPDNIGLAICHVIYLQNSLALGIHYYEPVTLLVYSFGDNKVMSFDSTKAGATS